MASAVYRIFSSAGALTDNGLALGSVPVVSGLSAALEIGTQAVEPPSDHPPAAGDLQYWSANGTSRGGSGSWDERQYLALPGRLDRDWGGKTGVFDGAAGTVTVQGAQAFENRGIPDVWGTAWSRCWRGA